MHSSTIPNAKIATLEERHPVMVEESVGRRDLHISEAGYAFRHSDGRESGGTAEHLLIMHQE